MRKQQYIIGCVLFLCTALSVQAQRTLSGRVLGPDSVALEDATVLLYLANDSLPLRVTTTDKRGEYTFQADTAHYVMQVSLMGYAPYECEFVFSGSSKAFRLNDVILREAVRAVGEVVVAGEQSRTTVALEDDKEVYTLSSRVKRNAASVLMALTDVPGLDVDLINNSVTVRGSEGSTQIMVNNIRRSKGYVQTIDPKLIERVEIIRFPGMRYTSRGVGGLVNIVTKEPIVGYSGNIGISQDPLLQHGRQSASFTAVHNKWTYSLNVRNFYFDEDKRESYTLRETKQGDHWNLMERDSYGDAPFKMFSPNVGGNIDYVHSPRSFSILSFHYTYSKYTSDYQYHIKEFTSLGNSAYLGMLQEKNNNQNGTVSFYHQTKWKDIHTLSVDAICWLSDTETNGDYREVETEGTLLLHRTNQWMDKKGKGTDVQVNMEHKWKTLTLGEGYRFFWTQSNQNNCINETYNSLLYDEWRNNLYVDLSGRFHPKWFYRVGVNLDITKIKILGSSNMYADVNPSVSLRYNMTPKQFVNVSYKRSRKMPGISMLNPIPNTVDSVRVYQGNPNLLPAHNNITSLGFYSYVKKIYLYLTLGYGWGESFSSISKINDKGINVITYGRTSEQRNIRASLDLAWHLTSWLKLGIVSSAAYSMYKDPNEVQFNKNLWSTNVMPYGTITGKRLYANFRYPITIKQRTFTGYVRNVPESFLNMSYRLNNSWRLLLECHYFEPMSFQGETDIEGYREYYREKPDHSFRVILGVNYSFRKGKSGGDKQRKTKNFESSSESDVRIY